MRRARLLAVLGAAGLALVLLASQELSPSAVGAALAVGGTLLQAFGAPGAEGLPLEPDRGAAVVAASQPVLALLATGVLLALVFGARAARCESLRELGLHVSLAFAAGMAASGGLAAGAGAPRTAWLLGVVLAALLTALPALVPRELGRTLALIRLAARAEAAHRPTLLRALVAQRRLAQAELPRAERLRARACVDAIRARCGGGGPPAHGEAVRLVRELVARARGTSPRP